MMMKMMPVKKKNERVKQFAAPTFKLIKQQQMGPRLLRAIYRFVDTVRGKDEKKEQRFSRV